MEAGGGRTETAEEEHSVRLCVPFPTAEAAVLARDCLQVDPEPPRSKVIKIFGDFEFVGLHKSFGRLSETKRCNPW